MYKVVQHLTVSVKGVVKTFPAGTVINLPEAAAKMFIGQGKIEPIQTEPGAEVLNKRRPYITSYGSLIIPGNSDRKYHYWKPGGQSLCDTLKELGRCDLVPKYRSIYN